MKRFHLYVITSLLLLAWVTAIAASCHSSKSSAGTTSTGDAIKDNANSMVDQGRKIFRFDTFGSEAFWGDTLKLHSAISGTANGGVGPGVSPATALAVGLKVDLDALPADLVNQLKNGQV